jgi:hypothetical protein
VQGAWLRITSLRAAAGPGVELLEYLTPRDGRPLAPDQRANDIAHWQTRLIAADAARAAAVLRAGQYDFISPGVVDVADAEIGDDKGLLVRDPDGHAMEVAQP